MSNSNTVLLAGHPIHQGIFLAPMEDVTDVSFRIVCKELGADFVYTEFVNSEGLVRGSEKTHKKMAILEEERPVGIQIYGGTLQSMVGAAQLAEKLQPDLIDINAGCWVKGVVGQGAGAALLKDPESMQNLCGEVVKAVSLPVTVKTRIGWDSETINILEVVKRLEDVGVQGMTIHCRTRVQGHSGDADWTWIEKIKNVVSFPIILNGGIMNADDVVRAFKETPADAVMIARGAIGNPWVFSEAKQKLAGIETQPTTYELKIKSCLKHMFLAINVKGERRAVLEQRKFYSGYLKGMRNASYARAHLMTLTTYVEVEQFLLDFLEKQNVESTPIDEVNPTV